MRAGNKRSGFLKFNCGYYWATAYQLAVMLLFMMAIRVGFYLYHQDSIGEIGLSQWPRLLWGGLRFDLWVLAYFNVVFIAIRFLPFRFVERAGWIVAANWLYGICNGVMLSISIADLELFSFFGSRMRWETLTESFRDPNMSKILLSYIGTYWWVFIVAAIVVAGALWLALRPRIVTGIMTCNRRWATVVARLLIFLAAAFATFICMRGHLGHGRPLSIGDGAWYAERPSQINVCLNSPFTLLRSFSGGYTVKRIVYFTDSELLQRRNSMRSIADSDSLYGVLKGKNLMIITLESGAQMWLDSMTIIKGDAA